MSVIQSGTHEQDHIAGRRLMTCRYAIYTGTLKKLQAEKLEAYEFSRSTSRLGTPSRPVVPMAGLASHQSHAGVS